MPSQCPYVQYIIFSTNCGLCPSITKFNDTSVSCLRPNVSTDENQTCIFTVQTKVCGSINGNSSAYVILYPNETGEYYLYNFNLI